MGGAVGVWWGGSCMWRGFCRVEETRAYPALFPSRLFVFVKKQPDPNTHTIPQWCVVPNRVSWRRSLESQVHPSSA